MAQPESDIKILPLSISVCGSGKSTLGRALSERLGFHSIDIEDLYFPKTDPFYLFASPRSKGEVEELIWEEIQTHENFVLASVKGEYGERRHYRISRPESGYLFCRGGTERYHWGIKSA